MRRHLLQRQSIKVKLITFVLQAARQGSKKNQISILQNRRLTSIAIADAMAMYQDSEGEDEKV
jgi:hypothetical protein